MVETISILKKHDEENAPILVHCSAGIGRTGTFIALSYLFGLIEKYLENHLDYNEVGFSIFGLVRNLREQRIGMVQTSIQYQMIYKLLHVYANNHFDDVGEDL